MTGAASSHHLSRNALSTLAQDLKRVAEYVLKWPAIPYHELVPRSMHKSTGNRYPDDSNP